MPFQSLLALVVMSSLAPASAPTPPPHPVDGAATAAVVAAPEGALPEAAPDVADDLKRHPGYGWQEPLERCHVRGRRFCDGPRRVPVPEPEARERAEALGLGTRSAGGWLLERPPPRHWVRAAAGARSQTLRWPVPGGVMGRGVGFVRRPRLRHVHHDGVDVGAPVGTLVEAANDGIVAYADNSLRGYGNLVAIVHGDGSVTLYAHLQAAYVTAGQLVGRGEKIGEVGATGLANGPHLHFEWRVEGAPADPVPAFRGGPFGRGLQGSISDTSSAASG